MRRENPVFVKAINIYVLWNRTNTNVNLLLRFLDGKLFRISPFHFLAKYLLFLFVGYFHQAHTPIILYYNTPLQYARMGNSGTPRTCKINIPQESILEAKNIVTYVSIFVFRFYFLIRASDKWNYRNEFHSAIYKILVVRCTCTLLTNWIKSLTNVTR